MDQGWCGGKKQRGELHDQNTLCNDFCWWSFRGPTSSCAVQQNLEVGWERKENQGMLTSVGIMKSGLGRIVKNSSEWGKGWWMKFNTNSCEVMNIRGKVVGTSYTAQNTEPVSSAQEPFPVVVARRLEEYPGVGQVLKSFTCLPASAVSWPPAAGSWRRGLQWPPGSGNHPECNGSWCVLGGLVQLCVLTQPPLTSNSLCPTAPSPQADTSVP